MYRDRSMESLFRKLPGKRRGVTIPGKGLIQVNEEILKLDEASSSWKTYIDHSHRGVCTSALTARS